MKKVNIDWEFFRKDIPIDEVADILGITTTKNKFFCCPCHNDNKPSAQLRMKTNTWCCYTCGDSVGGSPLDLVVAVNGGNTFDAAMFLNDMYPGGIEELEEVEEDEFVPPPISQAILKKLCLKHNPFNMQIAKSIQNIDKNGKLVGENQYIQLNPIQAAELVLDKCLEYDSKMRAFKSQIMKLYPGIGQEALNYITQRNDEEYAPIRALEDEMRNIIATQSHIKSPWEEEREDTR